MRSSSNAARAKVLRGASVLPFKPELITTPPAGRAQSAQPQSDRERHDAYQAGYEAGLRAADAQRGAEHADAMAD